MLKQFTECNSGFLSHVSQKKVILKECRVGLDKGDPDTKTNVVSHST